MAASALFAFTALPAVASGGPSVVGNWSVVDRGQGCWGGGNLLSDGSGNGGGGCAVHTSSGEEVTSLKPVSWSFIDPVTKHFVLLTADIKLKQNSDSGLIPLGIVPVMVPVGTGAPVNLFGDIYGKITLHP